MRWLPNWVEIVFGEEMKTLLIILGIIALSWIAVRILIWLIAIIISIIILWRERE